VAETRIANQFTITDIIPDNKFDFFMKYYKVDFRTRDYIPFSFVTRARRNSLRALTCDLVYFGSSVEESFESRIQVKLLQGSSIIPVDESISRPSTLLEVD